jgi:hypothetical protein
VLEGKLMDQTKILIIAANPWDTKRISPDEEYRDIKDVLSKSRQRDNFVLEYAPASSDAELRQALLDFEPNIVHFSGHGEIDGLCFQNAQGNTQFISKVALTRLFGLFAKQIKCVVLNACYSEEQAQAISQHIDYVVGMSKAIGDEAAVKFATGFYQALFNAKEVEFAFDFGCSTIELADIPEEQTPQLKKRQVMTNDSPPNSFLINYQYDLLIHAANTEKAWAENFTYELQKYLTQKLENKSCHIQLTTNDDIDFDQAATSLLVLSHDYVSQHQITLKKLDKHINQKRIFLAEYTALPRPENLRGLLSYCFWQADAQLGLRCFDKTDANYFLQIENIAADIVTRLRNLKTEQQVQNQLQQIRQTQPINTTQNDALVFVNVAPEDNELTEKIQNSLSDHGFGYAFPALENDPSRIREDLECKLLNCDAVLLIYQRGSPTWLDYQLMTCTRLLKKRDEPFKIIAVYTEQNKSKFTVNSPKLNLQVFYCPPEDIQDYLPLFMEALK